MPAILSIRLRTAAAGCLLLAGGVIAGTAGAQTPDARWLPWLGCWTSSDSPLIGVPAGGIAPGLVCVVPASSGRGVVVATIANGMVVHTESMNATGARTPKTVENCPGWESSTWSADGHRLLMRSEYACGKDATVKGSGVFAISADGEWLQVQGSTVGRDASAFVVRYRAAGLEIADVSRAQLTDSTPVRLVTATTSMAARSARYVAGEAVRPDAVLELTRAVEGPVAEAWVNEIGQRFAVNASELVRLADAGMPPKMIDLLVALSYPERFALQRSTIVSTANLGRSARGAGVGSVQSSVFDRYRDCEYGYRRLTYGYNGDSCYPGYYGFSPYSYGSAYGYGPYGYGPFSYGGYGGGYYGGQQPIIIVPRDTDTQPRGRAVNGAGYTRGSSTPARAGTSASDRSPDRTQASGSSSGSSSSGSASSGSSGSASSGSSSGSSGGDRTAKPRVPPG